MGWWQIGCAGVKMSQRATGMIWGDQPADILDNAIDEIRDAYESAWNRLPTDDELRAGLEFSLGGPR